MCTLSVLYHWVWCLLHGVNMSVADWNSWTHMHFFTWFTKLIWLTIIVTPVFQMRELRQRGYHNPKGGAEAVRSRTWVLNHPITLSNQISYPRNRGEATPRLGPDSACSLVPFLACSSCREPWSPGERPAAALLPSWSLHSLQSNFTACVSFNTYKSLGRQVSLPSTCTRWEAQSAQGWKRIWGQIKANICDSVFYKNKFDCKQTKEISNSYQLREEKQGFNFFPS